jgi:flagellar biosynthesis/type III secretory pathway M-ring protein FliF/YscJ
LRPWTSAGLWAIVRLGDEEDSTLLTAASTGWVIGIAIGVVVIAVAAVIVIVIVSLAMRISRQAATAENAVEVVRQQTSELGGIARINDSGTRILRSARALRKAAVGR